MLKRDSYLTAAWTMWTMLVDYVKTTATRRAVALLFPGALKLLQGGPAWRGGCRHSTQCRPLLQYDHRWLCVLSPPLSSCPSETSKRLVSSLPLLVGTPTACMLRSSHMATDTNTDGERGLFTALQRKYFFLFFHKVILVIFYGQYGLRHAFRKLIDRLCFQRANTEHLHTSPILQMGVMCWVRSRG